MKNSECRTNTVALGLCSGLLTLTLSACGGPSTPAVPDLTKATETCALPARPNGEQPGVLCGQLGAVDATQVKPTKEEVTNPREDLTATVRNKQFNQQLPSVKAVSSEYVPENDPIAFNDLFVCTKLTSSSSADLKIIPINLLETNTGQQLQVQRDGATFTTFTFWWYASKTEKVTISGTECFTFGSFSGQVLDLKLGWNTVQFTLNDDLKNSKFAATAPTTTRYTWTAASASGLIGQSGDSYFLQPWLHLSKYQDRR